MTTMAVALDRNLFLAYYSSIQIAAQLVIIANVSNVLEVSKGRSLFNDIMS